ncbi:MAG: TIGR03435 family protein, partial [Acidobacteria bacterium]|nr:TIGR03435 family protein [Acidobacteriota bacterium]
MTKGAAQKLDLARKLLLSGVLSLAVTLPIVVGRYGWQQESGSGSALRYEVASIKPYKSADNFVKMQDTPDGFSSTGGSLEELIVAAYQVEDNRVLNAPSWSRSERYVVQAKADAAVAEQLRKLSPEERNRARR